MYLKWKKQLVSLAAVGVAYVSFSPSVFAATSNSSQTYTVEGNDTFWSISHSMRIPLSSLVAANPGVDPLNLYPGLTIQLPKGATTSTSKLATPSAKTLARARAISCTATAYTAAASENGWGPVDYFGNPLKVGTIAVDPNVIPLGSTVYIKGYSFAGLPQGGMIAHATDEGTAIQGNRVDIFVPTTSAIASGFGLQTVKIYILK